MRKQQKVLNRLAQEHAAELKRQRTAHAAHCELLVRETERPLQAEIYQLMEVEYALRDQVKDLRNRLQNALCK